MALLPDASTALPLLALLLALLYLTTTLRAYLRLSHIPGPALARFSHLWMMRTAGSGRIASIFSAVHARYGTHVRIGPNQVLTSDVALLRRTGAVRGQYDRGPWYTGLRWAEASNVFNLTARVVHDRRKAQLVPGYSGRAEVVDRIEPNVDEQLRAMLRVMRDKYVVKEVAGQSEALLLDFAALSSYFTLDVICRLAFGREGGYLREDRDVTGFLAALKTVWPYLSGIGESPFLSELVYSDRFMRWFAPKSTHQNGLGRVLKVVEDSVDDRFSGKSSEAGEGRKDLLGSWIQHGLTRKECEAEALLAISAGSETTATVMRITLLCLLSSPRAYAKLKRAIKEHVVCHSGNEPESIISYAEARDIPYLKACIYEGMRNRPGTTGAFSKVVPPEGDTAQGGVFLPGGTLVATNTPAILGDTATFGADAAVFRPERWLEADPARRTEMEQVVEMMFGTGRWMCAGKPIAQMELFKSFFEMLRHFDFELANPMKPMDSVCYLVYVEENFWVRVTEDKDMLSGQTAVVS